MKATRAYIASLGTTSLLVASSLLILVVVSALVAFNGWPGSGASDRTENIVVGGDENPFRVSGPALTALDAAPAAAAVAASAAPTSPAAGSAPGGGGGPGRSAPAPGSGGGGGGAPGGGGGSVLPGTGAVPPVDVGQVGNNLANRTHETTDQVGKTVSPVSPQLGNTVSDTGKALSDIVSGLPDVGPPPKLR
jgi:hypothetical protein